MALMLDLPEFHRITTDFLYPLTLPETAKKIVQGALRVSGGKYGSLYLRQRNTFVKLYTNTPESLQTKPRRWGRMYQSFLSGKPLLHSEEERLYFHPEAGRGIRFECIIPLRNDGRSIGSLTILFTKGPLLPKKELLDSLEFVCSTGSLALRKSQLFDELQNSINMRDLFISVAAHELRTPLTTIIGASELIQSRAAKGQDPKLEWIDLVHEEAKRMSRLINELLLVQQIERGKFVYAWKQYNLLDIINRAVNDFSLANSGRPVQIVNLSKKTKLNVIADFDKLVQVFGNLLNNSHKWSPPGKSIDVKLEKLKNRWSVQVVDQGAGIPEEALGKIFGSFYKANAVSSGLGLGLYVSKRIIDRHKGTISIASRLGAGTTVTILLPEQKSYDPGKNDLK